MEQLVARRAHNPKVACSSHAPATVQAKEELKWVAHSHIKIISDQRSSAVCVTCIMHI
jgi:hypothetical protein